MFSKAFLVVSTFAAIAMAQIPAPTCYQGGVGPSSACSQFVNAFCDGAAMIPTRFHDSTGHCFNLPNNLVCDFIAWNSYRNNVPPSAANCKTVLRNVIARCPSGGYGQIAPNAYTFTVDPNRGQCSRNVHGGS